MTEAKELIIGNYYRAFSSNTFVMYLGENTYDGNNFIATHVVNEWNVIAEIGEQKRFRSHFSSHYEDYQTDYLNSIYNIRQKREDAIDSLLGG